MGRGKNSRGFAPRRPGLMSGDNSELEAAADAFLETANIQSATASKEAGLRSVEQSSSDRLFIGVFEKRIEDRLPTNFNDLDQQSKLRARGKALGVLSPGDQRRLVRIANSYTGMGRESIRERAVDLLILTNTGIVEKLVRKHGARGLEADVLRQECRLAIYKTIPLYDSENGASFLAFAEYRMRGAISDAIRSNSRLVRLRSRASEIADRIQRAIKLWDASATTAQFQDAFPKLRQTPQEPDESDEAYSLRCSALSAKLEEIDGLLRANKKYTLQIIADITGDKIERIKQIEPWVTSSYIRLDAPIATRDGEIEVASAIADTNANVEREVLDGITSMVLIEALGSLSPYERTLIEYYYGIGKDVTGNPVQQKDLYDGVYKDSTGQEYSAEQSVIADRRALIEGRRGGVGATGNPNERAKEIRTALQRELNERYSRGELVFIPNSHEARKLFELSGVPPTSATIQEGLNKIYTKIAPKLEVFHEDTLSRGNNALEYSETACEAVREELKRQARANKGSLPTPGYGTGKVALEEIEKLKPGKPAKNGIGRKGALRRVAEAAGCIDIETGKLTFTPNQEKASSHESSTDIIPSQTQKEKPEVKILNKITKIKLTDLLKKGLVRQGESLVLQYKGAEYHAKVLDDGRIQLQEEQARTFSSVSSAAQAAKGVKADDGWHSWQVERDGRLIKIATLRDRLRQQ